MAHSRKNIRYAVVALLKNQTIAGPDVYPNRKTAIWDSELPVILVYTEEEDANPRDISGRQSIRSLDLKIEIKMQATEQVDDDIDELAEQVQNIMSADPSLTATALSAVYLNTKITLDSESETEKGVAILTYQVKYIA